MFTQAVSKQTRSVKRERSQLFMSERQILFRGNISLKIIYVSTPGMLNTDDQSVAKEKYITATIS